MNNDLSIAKESVKIQAVEAMSYIANDELRLCDVLLGRGSTIDKYPGNVDFRKAVDAHKPLYRMTFASECKQKVAQRIVDGVSNNHGRFLRRISLDDQNGMVQLPNGMDMAWVEVGNETALEKTKQALRERRYGKKSANREGVANTTSYSSAEQRRFGSADSAAPLHPSVMARTSRGDGVLSYQKRENHQSSLLSSLNPPLQLPGSNMTHELSLRGIIIAAAGQNNGVYAPINNGFGMLTEPSFVAEAPLLNSSSAFGQSIPSLYAWQDPLLLQLRERERQVLERQAHRDTVELQQGLSNWLVHQQVNASRMPLYEPQQALLFPWEQPRAASLSSLAFRSQGKK